MKDENDPRRQVKDDDSRCVEALPFILAGLSGRIEGFHLFSVSLQFLGDGDYRVVLRGTEGTAGGATPRLVAFSNGNTPASVLSCAEEGFASDKLRWHLDKWASSRVEDAEAENGDRPRRVMLPI